MTWKYSANLRKTYVDEILATVHISTDNWELYERLVKLIEKVLNE